MKTVIMPKLDLAMDSGSIVEWFKKEGDNVEEGEQLVSIMTQKVTYEVASPARGVLYKILAPVNVEVPVGEPIAVILEPGDAVEEVERKITELTKKAKEEAAIEVKAKEEVTEIKEKVEERVKISPAARRLAEEYGIDVRSIKGTGPEGRITKEDVERAIEEMKAKKEKIIPLSGVRKIIAERMSESHRTIPAYTITMEVDATKMVEIRKSFKEKENIDLSYNALIVKTVAKAIRENPIFNATLDGDKIRILDDINIGLAVATDYGLVVPVIHNADKKEDIKELNSIIKDLVARAGENKLTLQDVSDCTFIVNNLGAFGVDIFTPIIFPGNVAILGVGRIAEKPVVVNRQIAIKPMMTLSLTLDHRVIDGAPAAIFLRRVKELLENADLLI